MLRKILLPSIFVVLAYGFWISPDFKGIAAGVSIFLFGMLTLEEGFKVFSGGILEKVLEKSTNTLYKSIGFGFITTAIMQSSGLVSVLAVSFIGAGLIGLAQGIGIIFGANIGTTTGAWLMAGFGLKIKISAYAMPLLVFGVLLIFQKAKSLKGIGYILAGIGFLFLGIHYMKEGFESLTTTIDLATYAVDGIKGLFIFVGIGIVATILMQSSHATIVLVLTALSVGQITYENAIALTIGANIGTTVTAVIASLGSNIDGKRLSSAHFIFNMVTAAVAIALISPIIDSVNFISEFIGIANDNYTLKLAVFDSLFKVMGVVMFIPFVDKLVQFLENRLKGKDKQEVESYESAQYLNDSVLEIPATAMAAIVRETKHLYVNAFEIIAHGLNIKRTNILSAMELEDVIKDSYSKNIVDIDEFYEHRIKGIYGEIIDFATQAQSQMSPEDIEELYALKIASKDIVDAVKDTKHLQKNLLKYKNNSNKHIQDQYNGIRIGLAELLRSIDAISKMSEEDEIILLLSKIKVHMQRYDILANGTLDKLIRNDLITNEMATSLMNDSSYAYEISKHFIAMAEVIFIDDSGDIKNLDGDMFISDEDVDSIIKKGE